jgi:hypothetical protein
MSQYFDNKDNFLEPNVAQYGSHMVMTNVHKSSKTKYVNIDTRFSDEYNYHNTENYNSTYSDSPNNYQQLYSNTANYTITLPDRLTDVKNISVKDFQVVLNIYNISATRGNNYFKVTDNSNNVTRVLTVPDGQYDAAAFKSAVNDQITNAGFGGLAYDVVTNKSTLNISGFNKYTIDFSVTPTGDFDKYNIKTKMGWLMGFREMSYKFTTNTSKKSEAFLDLTGSRYLYLAIDEFSKGNQNSFISQLPTSLINKNIIAKIGLPGTQSFGTLYATNIYTELITDIRSYTGKVNIQKLNIKLLDEFGSPVNLNGTDFSFCLKVEHE